MAAIYTADVLPALDHQIAAARALRANADDRADVWKLPEGDAFYATALRTTTTVSLSPDEVHRFGLD